MPGSSIKSAYDQGVQRALHHFGGGTAVKSALDMTHWFSGDHPLLERGLGLLAAGALGGLAARSAFKSNNWFKPRQGPAPSYPFSFAKKG